jgi:sugar O-acyltransferase (sialic acid O-acetyltransferase NeuD family)
LTRGSQLTPIVVFGASGHAKVVIDIVERLGGYRIVGLVDSGKPEGLEWFGYPIVGSEADLPELRNRYGFQAGIVAIGDNWTRHLVVNGIAKVLPDFTFIRAIHPSSLLGRGVRIGFGTVIMAGVTINSDTAIGDFCIVNTGASLDHDNELDDYVSVAPRVVTGGNVRVGRFAALSIGAAIIHGRTIGPHAVVGAGATVVEDVPGYSVAWGSPARVMKQRKEGDPYL